MMRRLLVTTALATMLSAPALAQNQPANQTGEMQQTGQTNQTGQTTQTDQMTQTGQMDADDRIYMLDVYTLSDTDVSGYLASNMLGKTVYTSTAEDAEAVGEINDIVVGDDGSVKAVVVGVGGFLGIGEKEVAIDFNRLTIQNVDGTENEVRAVTDASKEELESAQAFERPEYMAAWRGDEMSGSEQGRTGETARAPADDVTDDTAQAPAEKPMDQTAEAPAEETTGETAQAPAEQPMDQTAEAPAGDMTTQDTARPAAEADDPRAARQQFLEGKTQVQSASISADELMGATVYGANWDSIGEIGDIVLTDDGQIDAAVVDVGGFLGLGAKPVAVGFDKVEIYTDEGGGYHVATPYTEEQLEQTPEYDEQAYRQDRDTMRLSD